MNDLVIQAASTEDDVFTIIGNVIRLTYKIFDVERITLFIVDEIRKELWCKYV